MKKLGLLFLLFILLLAACSKDASSEKEDEPKEAETAAEEENKEEDKKDEEDVSEDDGAADEEQSGESESDFEVDWTNSNNDDTGAFNNGDVPEDYDFFVEEYNNFLEQLNYAIVYESEALSIYNQLIMTNVDDITAADTIYYEVLPVYEQYVMALEAIEINHGDLQAINDHLIDASLLQYEALVTLVEGLDTQNDGLINEAMQMMEMHGTESVNIIYEMAELSESYGIPYDTNAALQGLEGY